MTHETSPDEEIPEPRNRPMCPQTITVGMSPEAFERIRPQFMVDLARLLDLPPDDLEITAVRERNGDGTDQQIEE